MSGQQGRLRSHRIVAFAVILGVIGIVGAGPFLRAGSPRKTRVTVNRAATSGPQAVVLGFNDLGMHCMNQDFSEICILPPFNNLHAQVIDRRDEDPHIMTEGLQITYSIPGNTRSSNKTNFWKYAQKLFGVSLPADVGLTGNRLTGKMKPTGRGDFVATGIPITPITDRGVEDAYQLSKIDVTWKQTKIATTRAVVPVSWEISCNLCHNTPGLSVETDILRRHDLKHATRLEASKPVLCAKCHADPALGTPGVLGVSTMSGAMHGSHASRMGPVAAIGNTCYACHPGFRTNCQRDVHFARGIFCVDCHGGMESVAAPGRTPWVDEPRCETCHAERRPDFAFEQQGKLFKDSKGHQGVMCASCHGSPHAITPTVTPADNVQAIALQGHAGPIGECRVCHRKPPEHRFNHDYEGDD